MVEFELDTAESPASFTPLAYWHDDTHFTQVGDVRPYDIGHPSGLPVILVSRYRQTIAVLAANGMNWEE